MIEKVFHMFRQLFQGEYDPYQFTLDMEMFLFDHYDEMNAENPGVTRFLNEDVPDICAEGERGMDFTDIISRLKKIYTEASNMA